MNGAGLRRFIVINERDNVATALAALSGGETLYIPGFSRDRAVTLREDIPLGHKFALRALGPGARVIKYGQVIGVAVRSIAQGEHVHVHNVDGLRGRGDIA
jgi:altronate dehydratase small subunit